MSQKITTIETNTNSKRLKNKAKDIIIKCRDESNETYSFMKKRKKPIKKEDNLNYSFCKKKKRLNNSNKDHYKSIIQQKNINENEISHKEVKKSLNIIDCDEYEECLKNIVIFLKISVFEISCFIESFKFYTISMKNIEYINNIIHNIFHNNLFFHSYIQTKIRLENIYILLNQIINKFRNITNKIINNNLNLKKYYENSINWKNNFDSFIYNTNLILANLFNFVNNFKTCLSFFQYQINKN